MTGSPGARLHGKGAVFTVILKVFGDIGANAIVKAVNDAGGSPASVVSLVLSGGFPVEIANFAVIIDAITYSILIQGRVDAMAELALKHLDTLMVNCFMKNEDVVLNVNVPGKELLMEIEKIPAVPRTTFLHLEEYVLQQLDPRFAAVVANDFLNRKLTMYKNKFGVMYPMAYRGETPRALVERINLCLDEGKPAEELALKKGWEKEVF